MATDDAWDLIKDIKMAVSLTPSYTYTVNSPNTITGTGVFVQNTGTGQHNWSTVSNGTGNPMVLEPSGKLALTGENADIDVNGVSLVATLKRIEQRLNLLKVDTKLEADWDELRELGDQYRALEQRIQDKIETWNRLQAQDKDNR